MIDEAEDAIRRGRAAEAILGDPLFEAAFTDIRAELMEQIVGSPVRDAEGRERLYLMVRMLDRLRTVFVGHIENGKIEADNLAVIEDQKKRAAVIARM